MLLKFTPRMLLSVFAGLRTSVCLLLLLCLVQSAWAANTIDVSVAKNNLLLTPVHGGNGSAWGRDRCNSCHVINTIHKDALPVIREIAKNKGYPACAGCHGDNGVNGTVRTCVVCHNPQDLPQSPVLNEPKNHNFDTTTNSSLKDKDCLACHRASDMDGQFENNVDLTPLPNQAGIAAPYSTQTDFCLRCHNKNHQQADFRIKNTDPKNALSASEDDFLSIDVHGERNGSGTTVYAGLRNGYKYQSSVDCTDCHAMHSTHNDKLIIGDSSAGVFKLDAAFRQAKYSVNVSKDDDAQLCVLCHVMSKPIGQAGKDTGNGLAGVHLAGAGSNCRDCHAHGKDEKNLEVNNPTNNRQTGHLLLTPTHGKDGNGTAWGIKQCDNCHSISLIHKNAPNIKNIAEQKGYGACTGCHGSNGTDAPRPCAVCHNNSDLPNSPKVIGVKKHDFDATAILDLQDKQCVACHEASDMNGQFNNAVDLTVIPDRNGVKSPLPNQTEFCLRCHNQDHQQADFRIKNTDPSLALSASESFFTNVDVHGERKGLGISTYSGLLNGYQYQSSVDCSDCHAMHGTHNDDLIIGSAATGVFKLGSQARNANTTVTVSKDDDSQLCVLCHVMTNPVGMASKDTGNGLSGVHLTGSGNACRDCHAHGKNDVDLQAKTTDVSLAKGKLLLTPTHGKNANGSAWGIAQCDACHAVSGIHRNAPKIKDIVLKKGYATCMGCHGANGTVAGANVTRNPGAAGIVDANANRKCTVCHNVFDLPTAPDLNAAKNHNFKASTEQPLTDAMCIGCHAASDMNSQFELNTDLTHFPNKAGAIVDYNNSSEFCISCHNVDHQQPGAAIVGYDSRHPLVAMENNWNFIDVHGKRKGSGDRTYAGLRADVYKYASLVECVDCHAMHSTHNNKLIIDSTAKGVFKFPDFARKTPFLIDTPQGDYSQLCVTCHSMKTLIEEGAKNTGNGLSGVHQVGTDCRECHTHGMAAQTGL